MFLIADSSVGLSPFQVLALIIVAALLCIALGLIALSASDASKQAARDATGDDEDSRYEPTSPDAFRN